MPTKGTRLPAYDITWQTDRYGWDGQYHLLTQNLGYGPNSILPPLMELVTGSIKKELVNHPDHYNQGSIECIDAIECMLGRDGFIAWLRGEVIKYTWRLGSKGDALTDAKKAAWYQARLVRTLEPG